MITCSSIIAPIRAFAITQAFQQSPFASFPVLFLRFVDVVVWLMHIATKLASSNWTARKEYSPQGQSTDSFFKKNNIPSERTKNSATAKSSTTGLSTRPIVVAATRFRPLSESHPRHCRNTFPDDEDHNDHDVDTPSVGSAFFWLTTQSMEASCGKLRVVCG